MTELEEPAVSLARHKSLITEKASHSSSEDDYIVELRAPRPRRKKGKFNKHFKLVLSRQSSPDWSSGGSIRTPLPGRQRGAPPVEALPVEASFEPVPEETSSELPKEAEKTTDEDLCTQDNWKSFYSYEKEDRPGAPAISCQPAEFDQAPSSSSKRLSLIKIAGRIHLSIGSTFLQEQLRKVLRIEHFHGVDIFASEIVLEQPFGPLYHHVEEMKTTVEADTQATDKDRAHINALYYFATLGWPASLYKDVTSKISRGFIFYDDIWALFKPGDFAVTKDPIGHLSISKIGAVKFERDERGGPHGYSTTWRISLVKLTYKSGKFRKISSQHHIELFSGAKRINELDLYPLSHHTAGDEVRRAGIRRGKAWKKFCEGETRVMTYQGWALPALTEGENYGGTPLYPRESQTEAATISSTVIVDPGAATKVTMQASIDHKTPTRYHLFQDYGTIDNSEIFEFTDEDFMICPLTILVFELDNHEWFSVDVDKLKEKEWNPAAFKRLVLDADRKDTLIRLASTNSRLVQESKSKDVIEGKGKGVVLLLHGPPGVGKTLTAEVLSEYTKRPLLKVNLGRIASHKKWEQSLERTFSNAEDWKAILLIDEAEIVLEKRTFERLTQNSWISVFLRKLEYYKGILILTTNLIDCIDEAFESRISYPLRFHELRRDDRYQIWTDFIQNMKILPAHKTNLLNEVGRWSEAEINGRQIRNVILMAENIAASDEEHPRLMPHHIDDLLNVTIEFSDYNRGNMSRTKKIQLTGPSY